MDVGSVPATGIELTAAVSPVPATTEAVDGLSSLGLARFAIPLSCTQIAREIEMLW